MNDLQKLAIEGHGAARRWEQISRFRASASITGAIWAQNGQPGLLEGVLPGGETRDQRRSSSPAATSLPRRSSPDARTGRSGAALLVTYPDTVVAHHRQQTSYFDGAGLLRRLDYSVDILGCGPAVHSRWYQG